MHVCDLCVSVCACMCECFWMCVSVRACACVRCTFCRCPRLPCQHAGPPPEGPPTQAKERSGHMAPWSRLSAGTGCALVSGHLGKAACLELCLELSIYLDVAVALCLLLSRQREGRRAVRLLGRGSALSEVTPRPRPELPSPRRPGWCRWREGRRALRRRVSLGPAGSVDATEQADGGAAWGMASWGCGGGGARAACSHFIPSAHRAQVPSAPQRGSRCSRAHGGGGYLLCLLGPPLPTPQRFGSGWLQAHSWRPVRARLVRGPHVRWVSCRWL